MKITTTMKKKSVESTPSSTANGEDISLSAPKKQVCFDDDGSKLNADNDEDDFNAKQDIEENSPHKKSLMLATVRSFSRKHNGFQGKVIKIKLGGWHVIHDPITKETVTAQRQQLKVIEYEDGSPGDTIDDEMDDLNGIDGVVENNRITRMMRGRSTRTRHHSNEIDVKTVSGRKSDGDHDQSKEKSLEGATVRIVDGYQIGQNRKIVEERSGYIFKLDNSLRPFTMEQLEVIRYASNPSVSCDIGNEEIEPNFPGFRMLSKEECAKHKMMNATVRATLRVFGGDDVVLEGNVTSIFYGKLYVTQNGSETRMLMPNEFEVLKYANNDLSSGEDDELSGSCSDNDEEDERSASEKLNKLGDSGGRRTRSSSHRSCRNKTKAKREDDSACSGDDGDQQSKFYDNNDDSEDADNLGGKNVKISTSRRVSTYSTGCNPLIGVTAFIFRGRNRGLSGKIIQVKERGWWVLENPYIDGCVKSNQCKLVEDSDNFNLEAIIQDYEARGAVHRMPGIIKRGQENIDEMVYDDADNSDNEESFSDGEGKEPNIMAQYTDVFKRKISQTDFIGKPSEKKRAKDKPLSEKESLVRWGRKPAVSLGVPNVPVEANKIKPKRQRHYGSVPVLDPILLQPTPERFSKNNISIHNREQVHIQLVPAQIRHLPPDTRIDIFNRKTGKIMSGDESIILSDLPSQLMNHAEYEPIVPPQSRTIGSATTNQIERRQGRSAPNVRVSSVVNPQSRVRGSAVEGKNVLVLRGPYRGLCGTIDSCIPGGWYVVSNLLRNDNLDLDVIVNSQYLKIIPVMINLNQQQPVEGEVDTANIMIQRRIHLQAAKLRLGALIEEKQKILGITNNGDHGSQLKRLGVDIELMQQKIIDLERILDSAASDSRGNDVNMVC